MTRLAINIRNLFRRLNFVGTFHFALHDPFGISMGFLLTKETSFFPSYKIYQYREHLIFKKEEESRKGINYDWIELYTPRSKLQAFDRRKRRRKKNWKARPTMCALLFKNQIFQMHKLFDFSPLFFFFLFFHMMTSFLEEELH